MSERTTFWKRLKRRVYRRHFNVRTIGIIRNLADDCVIEIPGFDDRFGISMDKGIELPLACAANCSASVNLQRMSVKAAVSGDVELLKQAVLHDKLVDAVPTSEEVLQMVDEMIIARGL